MKTFLKNQDANTTHTFCFLARHKTTLRHNDITEFSTNPQR